MSALVTVAVAPPVASNPTPTPTPTHGGLAATGTSDVGRNVGLALALLVLGAALVAVGRRRYAARHH
jgi:hypothetical protein